MLKNFNRFMYFILLFVILNFIISYFQLANASSINPSSLAMEDDHVFMGKCSDGRVYRLVSYKKIINGLDIPFYDYAGPAGQGTVKTNIQPKVMAVRVCRELAEISDDPNLD